MSPEQPTSADLAISALRGELLVGITSIDGKLSLLVQRAEQTDERFQRVDDAIARLETRMDAAERTQVTRAEMDAKRGRTLVIAGLAITALGIVIGAAVSVITIVVGGS